MRNKYARRRPGRNKYAKYGPSVAELAAWAVVYVLGGALLACAAIGYVSILTA